MRAPISRPRRRSISDTAATGETARTYHSIQQTLRVTGTNLIFRSWAPFARFFPVMWEAMRPNVETRAFEHAADLVRAQAAGEATRLGKLDVAGVTLGEGQAYRLRGLLDLYHYVNPKLLLIASAVDRRLAGEPVGGAANVDTEIELIERGAPPSMHAMEMESERPSDHRTAAVFADIRSTLDLPAVNSDYRSVALFPEYLAAAWRRLKPIDTTEEFRGAASRLRAQARGLLDALPFRVDLDAEQLRARGEDVRALGRKTESFVRLLPGLILNVALLELEWVRPDDLPVSPYPAASRVVEVVA